MNQDLFRLFAGSRVKKSDQPKAMGMLEYRFHQDEHLSSDEGDRFSNQKMHTEDLNPSYHLDDMMDDEDDSVGKKNKKKKKSPKTRPTKKQKIDLTRQLEQSEFEETGDEDENNLIQKRVNIVRYNPAMLPEVAEEYNQHSYQDMKEIDEKGMKRPCKLCDLGDNGVTKHSSEVLKELFSMDQTLFRKVPDQVIWKLMCEKWRDIVVIPNFKGYGIVIEELREAEARRHYKFHDLSNVQRLLWDIIGFILKSMQYMIPNGGIWQERVVNGVTQDRLVFNMVNFKCYDRLINKTMRLMELSERIDTKNRKAQSESSGRSNPTKGYFPKRGKKSDEGFTPY